MWSEGYFSEGWTLDKLPTTARLRFTTHFPCIDILLLVLWIRSCFYPHLKNGKTKAQSHPAIQLKLHRRKWQGLCLVFPYATVFPGSRFQIDVLLLFESWRTRGSIPWWNADCLMMILIKLEHLSFDHSALVMLVISRIPELCWEMQFVASQVENFWFSLTEDAKENWSLSWWKHKHQFWKWRGENEVLEIDGKLAVWHLEINQDSPCCWFLELCYGFLRHIFLILLSFHLTWKRI